MPADSTDDDRTVDEPLELPDNDTELIAYLDGELDGDEAAQVEARLAGDPAARTAAEAYRKSFDMLDYLPKPEPSPDFTARTVTRLQPAIPFPVSGSQPVAVGSGSATVPVAAVSGSGFVPALPPPRRAWPELLAWTVAAVLVLVLGYVGHSVARPLLYPPPVADQPTLADLEVIERLPLYLGVDDLSFLKQLAESDLFDDAPPPHPVAAEQPSAEERAKLIALFRSLPPARQQQLRTLHQELAATDAKLAPTLRATLDAYAAWLDRLPDADRKKVLTAPTSAERLDAVRQVKEGQWRATLTPRQKDRLKEVQSTEERLNLAAEFRDQEQRRRDEWKLAQHQWQSLSEKGQKPWPFSDDKLTRQIDGYVRTAFGADLSLPLPDRKNPFFPPPGCRLTREQYLELKALHDAAGRDGYWLSYGACLLRLSDALPTLPPPKDGKPVVHFGMLAPSLRPFVGKDKDAKEPKGPLLNQTGKWPEFALAVHNVARFRPKADTSLLGPCRPGEFAEEVNSFVTSTLTPKLSATDRTELEKLAGKWPEYPRRMMELARKHDLSVPGVTLPGEPSKWEQLYRLPSGKR